MPTKKDYDPWIDYSRYRLEGDEQALLSLGEHHIGCETIQNMHFIWSQLPQDVQYFGSPDYDYLQIESFLENRVNHKIPLFPAILIAAVALIAAFKLDAPILGLSIVLIIFLGIQVDRVIRSNVKQALRLLHQTSQPNDHFGSA
ncbi:hypothetical protein [Geothrix oryzisoli]|uniref:hypothetical protein n=1 Tax=Geothrix oryzisoli TaxID=2922721 RepID=UPI001FAE0928|nr:hypothetical protein [Geothrix oryzisoli]